MSTIVAASSTADAGRAGLIAVIASHSRCGMISSFHDSRSPDPLAIDAPSRGVSVFEIPVGAAAAVAEPASLGRASSVVVWVDDDPGSK